MIRTTPFHPRTEAANRSGLWSHWAGYLAADRYQVSDKAEYFAIRNSAGIFDTSPLYKYRVEGSDAERFLSGVLARDIRRCSPGRAQYTVWCDDKGRVIEDGVVLRLGEERFLMTSARPNLSYFERLTGGFDVVLTDVSEAMGALAVQGPSSRSVVGKLWPEVEDLPYFGVTSVDLEGAPVVVSRTGFTGDLGYELWVGADAALDLWDAVMAASSGLGVVPVGQDAVLVARVEAGLLLIDVDYRSARFAWTATDRVTPMELGLGWMIDDLSRAFVGRDALTAAIDDDSARWRLTGLMVDWQDWDRIHAEAGLLPPKDHRPAAGDHMVYEGGEKVGWASSFIYSPMLQRHIALARVRPDLAGAGNRLQLEVTVDHDNRTVDADVVDLPFYRPAHRTA